MAVGIMVFPTVVFVRALAITPTVHPAEVPRVSVTVTDPIVGEIVAPAAELPRSKVAGTEIVNEPAGGGGALGVVIVRVISVARTGAEISTASTMAEAIVMAWNLSRECKISSSSH